MSKEYTIEGVEVKYVYPINERQYNGKTFRSCEIALAWVDEVKGRSFNRFRLVTCGYDKVIDQAKGLKPGDIISVTCRLNGNAYNDKNTGEKKVWNKDEVQEIIKGTPNNAPDPWPGDNQAQTIAEEFGGNITNVEPSGDFGEIPF